MKVEIRRQGIMKRLSESTVPVSAGSLAEEFGVSRQIIVKDIAKLREEGEDISAFARGYALTPKARPERVFKVIHTDDEVRDELSLIMELGGAVEDVFIFHKFYGKVRAKMNIRTRGDMESYIENITSGKSSLLKNVTSGYHYHTVTADTFKTLKDIEDKLWERGFLASLQEHEPDEIDR